MTTTTLAVERISARCGFPKPRVRAVARALTDAGRLPLGGPHRAPELGAWDVVDIIIGSAVDVPLRRVAAAVEQYRALGLPGHDASAGLQLPAAKYQSAGDYLDILAEMAAGGSPDAQRAVAQTMIEVVATWPEIFIEDPARRPSLPRSRRT